MCVITPSIYQTPTSFCYDNFIDTDVCSILLRYFMKTKRKILSYKHNRHTLFSMCFNKISFLTEMVKTKQIREIVHTVRSLV